MRLLALTDRQYEIVETALEQLQAGDEEYQTENEATLEAVRLSKPIGPPSPDKIPLFLNGHIPYENLPVGYARVQGERMIIEVHSPLLTTSIAHLVSVGDIKELYLGVGYTLSPTELMRNR